MSDPPIRSSEDEKSLREDRGRHEECLKVLDELERCVEDCPDNDAKWVARIRSCFATFADALRLHFEGEERGALYRDLPVAKPRLADCIEELRREHRRLLADLDRVVRQVADLREERAAAADARDDIRRLIATLRRHEADETDLLQSAYWREVGTGD